MKFRRKQRIKSTDNTEPQLLSVRLPGAGTEELQVFTLKPETTLLDCLLENKIPMFHSCGGSGTCGTCRLTVDLGLGNLNARNELESDMAIDRKFAANERLSCQTKLKNKKFERDAESNLETKIVISLPAKELKKHP